MAQESIIGDEETEGFTAAERTRMSRATARRAAQDAAKAQLARARPFGTFGRVALYTWGALAIGSIALAGVALVAPGIEAPDALVAEISQPTPSPSPSPSPAPALDARDPGPVQTARAPIDFPTLPDPTPQAESATLALPTDPVATGALETQSAAIRTSFGTEIARSTSIPGLVDHYRSLDDRAPDIFAGLEPLIRLDEESELLEAALIAGPFESADDAELFCRTVRLRLMLQCRRSNYEGDAFLPR